MKKLILLRSNTSPKGERKVSLVFKESIDLSEYKRIPKHLSSSQFEEWVHKSDYQITMNIRQKKHNEKSGTN